jgi:rhodanese-related sulfurtransferase
LPQRGSWSPRPDSNRGPSPYQGDALPPELRGRGCSFRILGEDRIHSAAVTIDELLDRARRQLARVEPEQAAAELARGVLLVDIRPADQRAEGGDIPGATVIDRNVLEWRLAPDSQWRIDGVARTDTRVIVLCNEGYSSSLAAATLKELGLVNATDVIGGFQAWKRAGLPIET